MGASWSLADGKDRERGPKPDQNQPVDDQKSSLYSGAGGAKTGARRIPRIRHGTWVPAPTFRVAE